MAVDLDYYMQDGKSKKRLLLGSHTSGHTTKDWEHHLGLEKDTIDPIQQEIDKTVHEDITVEQSTFNTEDIKTLAKEDLNFLAGLCMPENFVYMFPSILLAAWSLLVRSALLVREFPRVALGIPRGFAKTTLVKLFIVWCILFTNKRFILIIGNTEQHAINILADVAEMLSHPNIIATFGDWRTAQETYQEKKLTQTIKKFGFRGRQVIMVAIGQGGSLRGMNLGNERPDIIVFDDIQSKEEAESPVVSDSILKWMLGTASKARSPHGCMFIFCANMYPGPNSILKKLKTSNKWIKFITGAILENGASLWEELFPIQTLLDEMDNDIALGHPEIFFSEMMNDTEVGVNTSVDFSKIKLWPFTEADRPQGKFILIDPSSGKASGDLCAIGGFHIYDETPALVELVTDRLSPGNTIRSALLLALRMNCKVIAVESIAYQQTLLYWFGVICDQLGIHGMQFLEVYNTQNSKNSRIMNSIKGLQADEVYIHNSIRPFVLKEISNWNPLKRDNTDNILDLLTYAPRVLELYGYLCLTDEETLILDGAQGGVRQDNLPF